MKYTKMIGILIVFSMIATMSFAEEPHVVSPPKKVVAVSDFEIKAGGATAQIDLSKGLAEMLTDALIQSNQFIVLERQALDAVMAEQNLAASNRTSKVGGAQMGDIKRAQVIIQGVVSEYQLDTQSGGQAFSVSGFSFGGESSRAHIGLIIRLIDTTTSQVIDSQRVEGSASEGGTSFGVSQGAIDLQQSASQKMPIDKAVQIAIDNAVNYVAIRMGQIPWKGKIIKVDEQGTGFVNAGSLANIQNGMIFMIFRPGEELIDPDTGLNLGSDETFVGRFRVNKVFEKFSKGKPLDGIPQAGDIVKFAS